MSARSKLLIVLLVIVASAVSSIITFRKVQGDGVIHLVNVRLYDLNVEMDLLEYWHNKSSTDDYLEKKIKHLILGKLVMLSNLKPQIDKLRGVPLEALHRVIAYSNEYGLGIGEHDDAFQSGLVYLREIEGAVSERMKERSMRRKSPFKEKG